MPSSFDPSQLSECLTRRDDGLWVVSGDTAVSYPADGHERCLEVEDGSFWFRHRGAAIRALIDRYPPDGVIFDVGGGNGFVALDLESVGRAVVLVEPGPVGAANALRRGVSTVIRARLEDAGLPAGSLPAVGLFDVLEHLEDDVGALSSIRDLLAPRGRVYITVPAHRWLWSADDTRAGHFRRYSRRRITRALEGADLVVDFASYTFAPLVIPIFLARTLPSLVGLRRLPSKEAAQREHGSSRGRLVRLLEWILAAEERRLAVGARQRIGASLIVSGHRP